MSDAGNPNIQGFATDISVNVGQAISFKIKTPATAYKIDIYRMGYYGGNGARKIATVTPSASLPQNQPACITSTQTEIYDCGNWAVSASWAVPATAVSGVYLAKPIRTDGTAGTSHIPFVVRNDASHSAVFFKTSDATWQAYNTFGGSDMYVGAANGRAYKISYNRPFATRGWEGGRDYVFSNEYPMIRFLEQNGYDLSYTTDIDTDRRGSLIKNHKVFTSTGHDEYWSGPARTNVESARDAGVSLAFFSGNEVYWKTRLEPSVDGSNTANRTIVCYKETWANAKIDPSSEWTGTFRDPRFSPPANGGRPENSLTGNMYMSNNTDLSMEVPAEQGRFRVWRSSPVASRAALGQLTTLAPHTVGYESDEDLDNGFRPAGLIRMSKTTGSTPEYLQDFGSVVKPGTTTHYITMYRAASGALVFGAGTIQWAWGLDREHDGAQNDADQSIQQATVNILADMGAQPATLMSDLTAVTASTDTTAPTATFTSPANNTTVTKGNSVTVSGTAVDTGGKVAGVEVSTDGGTTWHPATGTTSWTYSFYPNGVDTQVLKVRATDDSANLGSATSTLTLKLTGADSLFGARVPGDSSSDDGSPVEVGVKFVPQSNGTITGMRFYKGSGNTGSHVGTLWTSSGTKLAQGTFGNESASGWQTLTFSSPVEVNAGTTYVVSYFAPSGHYAADNNFFSAGDWKNLPLVAPRSQTSGGNGVYRAGAGFPNSSFGDTNYYVDVVFNNGQTLAPSVISVNPAANADHVSVSTTVAATFSKALNQSSITFSLKNSSNASVAGSFAYDSTTKTVTFTPTANLTLGQTYTATVNASDTTNTPLAAPMTWTFTTTPFSSFSTMFATNATPASTSVQDPQAVTLGVRFKPAVDGQVVGVRYYQGPGNNGTHTGSLYSASGTLLARATFDGGTGSGWQTVYFSSAVNVTANTTYVVSYYAPTGNYAVTGSFFNSAWTSSDNSLSAPAGSNGIFHYGSDSFPTDSWNNTNYWVDALFVGSGPPPPPPTYPANAKTVFTGTDTPASANWADDNSVNVGMKFSSSVAGSVAGVRFYKGSANTGTHVGSLYSATGTLLATGTFVNESASGWQTLLFSTPVAITPGTTYVVAYHMDAGQYAVTANDLAAARTNSPLSVPAGGALYGYGATAFPSSSSNHNYWVDVVFAPSS